MAISSEQVRAARALLRWEQQTLAEASKVSLPTIKRLETQPGALAAQPRTVEAIRIALSEAGVQFIPENGGGAGVRLAKSGSPRRGPSAALEAVLSAFAEHQLPKAMQQEGVEHLQFVRAGPQATLMEGAKTIGLVTLREDGAIFKPPLPAEQTGAGYELAQVDIWNWVIAAWRKSRSKQRP